MDGRDLDVKRDGAMFGLGQDGKLFAAGRYPDLYLAQGPSAERARSLLQKWFDKGVADHPRGAAPRCVKGTSHRVVLFRKRRNTGSYLQIQLGEKQFRVHDLTNEELELLTNLEWVKVASDRAASHVIVNDYPPGELAASVAETNASSSSTMDGPERGYVSDSVLKVAQAAAEAARAAADAAKAVQLAAEAVAQSVAESLRAKNTRKED
jgi:hypothetical protein